MDAQKMLELVKKYRLIAILRGIGRDQVQETAEALCRGGIKMIEVTFDQKDPDRCRKTGEAIRLLKDTLGSGVFVGAGTVMSEPEVEAAYQSGAEFALSPNVNEAVIRAAVQKGMAMIPGAMTPTEAAFAYERGAALIKLFPAGNLGIDYCKSIMSPLNHIPFIATGAVGLENLQTYLKAGFSGAGIGSALTNRDMIRKKDYEGLQKLAQAYTEAARME